MRRGRAIGTMVGATVALMAISLFVLSNVPSDSKDSTEQVMTYLSLMLFMMAVALIGALAVIVSRKEGGPRKAKSAPEKADDELDDYDNPDDGASDIELEFQALEREIEREERS
ncbi:MAG TPA: hypothetical protein VMW71_07410 [Thermoplasmata archaeon]|nr:hypothetical protein [Thermoplasmata archaeon]